MPGICLYFQVHQPYRLRPYTFFDLGFSHEYENTALNREILDRVSDQCYLPANALLKRLIADTKGKFQVAFSFSGVVLDQLADQRPDVLASFKELVQDKAVTVLGETYYHSLAGLYDPEEFERQVKAHKKAVKQHLNASPKIFRNTELLYNPTMAKAVLDLGYDVHLAEGVDWHLQGSTANQAHATKEGPHVLLRNHRLTDDIAFRYGQVGTPADFVKKVKEQPGDSVNLFMDYETLGEHHRAESGIFEYVESLVTEALKAKVKFLSPRQAFKQTKEPEMLYMPTTTSWADAERDASAWNGNAMQSFALLKVYQLGALVRKIDAPEVWDVWGRLQTSDHFYYMSTKGRNDGQVHDYFNPFSTPYDAYIHYMNVLSDVELEWQKRLDSGQA